MSEGPNVATGSAVLAELAGQHRAQQVLEASVRAPVHAYLFLGPTGSGKRDAALAFATALVCPDGGCGNCPACRDAKRGLHPDIVLVERSGASILVEEAQSVLNLAQRSPRVAARQVIILVDFHLVDRAAPMLLKTIEEPPDSTVFLVLADVLAPSLETIASRCLRVDFVALSTDAIKTLLKRDGLSEEVAARTAPLAGGRIDRARLLAADAGFAARQAAWRAVPERLDGSGHTVVELAGELLSSCDELAEVLRQRQAEELAEAASAAERAGLRGIAGRQAIEDRHKRELRRARTDELRAGLGSLAGAYRARLSSPELSSARLGALARACERIDEISASLVRNPNEQLLLQSLLLELDLAR